MKKYWIPITILVLIVIAVSAFFVFRQKAKARVTINNKTINVELAQTDTQREQGLMNRSHLDANSGMLFVFPKSDIQTFWMKDTLIPLDIVWLNNNRIVEMTTLQIPNGDTIPEYTPKNKANYVLELNAGEIIKNDFKVGDVVKIKY